MTRVRKFAQLVVALVMVGAAGACGSGGSSAAADGELVVGSLLGPGSLDPTQATGGSIDQFFLAMVYDRLLEIDPETTDVVAGLATEWGYSDDKKSFDITLREGVEFSDGTPVDAEAVKLNLERNFKQTKLGQITSVKSVEVVSPTQLRLTMGHESAWLPQQLAGFSGFMVSPAAFADTDDVSGDPVGSGPYRIKSNVPGLEIVFEKNPDYWNDERGFYDTIRVKYFKTAVSMNQALQSGSIQVAARTALTDVATLEKDQDLEVEVAPSLAIFHVQFNTVRPALKDPRVRQAFNFALDRAALAEAATGGLGEPVNGLFPTEYAYSLPATEPLFPYDPDRARALLADAGEENPEIDCVTYSGSGYEQAAPYIIEQLEDVGFKVNLEVTELSEATGSFYNGDDTAKAAEAPDCFFTTFPGLLTPRDSLNAEYGMSVYNNGHAEYVDPALLAELETTYDEAGQKALVEQIELEHAENPGMANMYTKPKAFSHDPSVQAGVPNLLEFDIDMASLRPAED
jgi:peptide/nickel transport system substrate-binding protein